MFISSVIFQKRVLRYSLVFTLIFLCSSEHLAVVSTKFSCIITPPQKSSPVESVSFTYKAKADSKQPVTVGRVGAA